jgi:hypothetical protein
MLKLLLLVSALVISFQLAVFAQSPANSSFTTVYPAIQAKKYKIVLNTGKKLVARSLDSLARNTLYITNKKRTQAVSVETINKLKIAKKRRPVLRGIAFGGLSGAAAGAIIGLATYKEPEPGNWVLDFGPGFSAFAGGVAGFLGGMLIGGIVGADSYRYTTHDLDTVAPAGKAAAMANILSGQ